MDVKEAIERLKLCSTNQCNICGRYEKEECMLERNRCERTVLSELEKKDKIIDEMARALKEYANLGYLIKCPAEYDGKYNYKYCKIDITKDKTLKTNRLCLNCIIDYFTKKAEGK